MALDTTVLDYQPADPNQYRSSRGIESKLKTSSKIQVAKRTNVDVSPTGTKYWYDIGVCTTIPKINDAIEVYESKTGGVTKVLGTLQIGREANLPIMIKDATVLGQNLSSKAIDVPDFGAVPVSTDIDDTAGTDCTIFSIVVTAVTGFVVGDEIELGTEIPQQTRIKSIDTTGKVFNFETPISQLPPDATTVKKVFGWKKKVTVNPVDFDYVYRQVDTVHSNKTTRVTYFANAQHKAISSPDSKEGKTAEEMGFTLNLQATPIMSDQTTVLEDVLYEVYTINS